MKATMLGIAIAAPPFGLNEMKRQRFVGCLLKARGPLGRCASATPLPFFLFPGDSPETRPRRRQHANTHQQSACRALADHYIFWRVRGRWTDRLEGGWGVHGVARLRDCI